MEKISSKENVPVTFDREAVAIEASSAARRLIAEQIDESLVGEERFTAVVELMERFSDDNNNRFVVEALAQRLSYEREVHALENLIARYPLAA